MADRLGVRLLGEFRLDGVELDALRSRQARTLLKRLALERGGTVVGGQPGRGGVAGIRDRPSPTATCTCWSAGPGRSSGRTGWCAATAATRCSPTGGTSPSWPSWPARPRDERTPATRRRPDRRRGGARAGARAAARRRAGRGVGGRGPVGGGRRRWPRYAGSRPARRWPPGRSATPRRYATEALRSDPYDEAALRTLMRAHVAAGRPASALAEFARVRELLAEELGVDPPPETRALHEAAAAARSRRPSPRGRGRRLGGSSAGPRSCARWTRSSSGRGPARGWSWSAASRASARPRCSTTGPRWPPPAGVVVLRGRAEEGELALQPVLDALAGRLADARHPTDVGRHGRACRVRAPPRTR